MFKIIDQQGFELDLKKQIDKFIKNLQDHDTFAILERYKNFLDTMKVEKNEFIVPKFANQTQSIRKEFIDKHRELYRRFDD